METAAKNQLLRIIGFIYEEAQNCKLEESCFEKLDVELIHLGNYFKVSKTQTFFACLIFALNFKRNSVDFTDMIDYLGCNPLRLLEFSNDIEVLEAKGVLRKEMYSRRRSWGVSNTQYSINEALTEAILKNFPLPDLIRGSSNFFEHVLDLMEAVYNMGYKVADDEMKASDLFAKIECIVDENTHLPLIRIVSALGLVNADNFLFLYLVWKYLTGSQTVDVDKVTRGMFDETAEKIKFKQELIDGRNELIKMVLIEVVEGDYINDAELKLTDKALQLVQDTGLTLMVKKKPKNIIIPDEIPAKELFFSGYEKSQLQMLASLLDETKLKEVQERLSVKALPRGVTVLFHGYPGTGKTESVFQLAKQTNRTIMKVDISQTKSMWFGESEKVIKRIFNDYRAYAKECDKTPILLFNEADAIISKRKDSNSSNVAQTENAIQNIILDELENFDGIFMATTNLVKNIDMAFDRRFLFKVEFQKPDIVAKAMIWQSKLPWLLPEDCRLLANQFDFSGGQIDNVVRKVEVEAIINDNLLSFELVTLFCNQELMVRESRGKVGF
jgi:hypothetical protein